MSANFIISRGCPIKHLARMEANQEKPVMFVFKHEYSNEAEAEGQLTYLPLDNGKKNLLVEVSQFVYVFQEIVLQFFTQLYVIHLLLAILTHEEFCILRRKGSYFSQSVNGFV